MKEICRAVLGQSPKTPDILTIVLDYTGIKIVIKIPALGLIINAPTPWCEKFKVFVRVDTEI